MTLYITHEFRISKKFPLFKSVIVKVSTLFDIGELSDIV